MREPRNKSSCYVSGEQGTAMRPRSSRRVSAVSELNKLLDQMETLKKAAMRCFLAEGCGCGVDHDERDAAHADLGKAIGAEPYPDNSGYDVWSVAYKTLGRPDPSEGR